jgi:hypothetical protein
MSSWLPPWAGVRVCVGTVGIRARPRNGPHKYRVPAGLPDKKTTGNCLITGKLLTTLGVAPKPNRADPVWPPDSYRYYSGALDEFVITNPEFVVVETRITPLFLPYGDDPDHPPTHVAPC